jgi:hypothetical protein
MRDLFIRDLRNTFISNSFTEDCSSSTNLFVEEIRKIVDNHPIKCTSMSDVLPVDRHFKIFNTNQDEIAHICIDGDFIPYGQHKYDVLSPTNKDRRPECMVFENTTLVFLELKVEQEDATFDKPDVKWDKFFEGVAQIQGFVNFLKNNSFDLKNYFKNIKAVVCMRFEPALNSNAKRNSQKLKRSIEIGFEIIPHNHNDFFNLP